MSITLDAPSPAGNILLDAVDGTTCSVRPDLRDTAIDWFYWCLRVRLERPVPFRISFDPHHPIGVLGPAISRDQGWTWTWLGRGCVSENAFTYTPHANERELWFSFGMPYTRRNLDRFLQAHVSPPFLQTGVLCQSRRGRPVPWVRIGSEAGAAAQRVLVTARHHACEMMASHELEGMMHAFLTSRAAWAERWRQEVSLLVIPFMDYDGVEDGDQGKARVPRDHNRDYEGVSVHPETAALRDWVQAEEEAGRAFGMALDLHDPHIGGAMNERIYMVGSRDSTRASEQRIFSQCLESCAGGTLPFLASDFLPFGTAWNTGANYADGMSFAGWASGRPGMRLASTLELPYARARGVEVNAGSAYAFGERLAQAMAVYAFAAGSEGDHGLDPV